MRFWDLLQLTTEIQCLLRHEQHLPDVNAPLTRRDAIWIVVLNRADISAVCYVFAWGAPGLTEHARLVSIRRGNRVELAASLFKRGNYR